MLMTVERAVRALDADPDKIVGILTRRDDGSPSDWIRVMIDSYSDKRTAYEFAVNAAGVKQDRYWFADTNSDSSWDAVWDVAVARSAATVSRQISIPTGRSPASARLLPRRTSTTSP